MKKIEKIILKNLLCEEPFTRKVIPYLKSEYFQDNNERLVFDEVQEYVLKYNQQPTKEALEINISNKTNLNEKQVEDAIELVHECFNDKEASQQEWLARETEKFCQDRALYNAVSESIQIMDGSEKLKDRGMIPKLLSDALAVSFDPNIGHDYIGDSEERYDYYHRSETRIPFDLDYFNKITKGGLPKKTLTVALAGTGVGKSLFMCHHAAACLAQNLNVLYITLEMAEERIAERIDANLLNVNIGDLESLSKIEYDRKISKLKENIKGKLIIKEYPTASAHAGHFKALMNELALKKKFKPDIVFIDYINICSSFRIKHGTNVNSYSYVKSIAEELRGFAIEFDIPLVTATQTTRSGFNNSDPGLEDTAESFGLPATADLMFVMISDEEMSQMDRIVIKQLKNRYNDPNHNKRFVLGIDRSKMRLYNVEENDQKQIQDTGQKKSKQEKTEESDVSRAIREMTTESSKGRFLDKLKV